MTSFGEAFKAARKAGKTVFSFNGKKYHTKTKDEMVKVTAKVPVPKQRPTAAASTPSKTDRAAGIQAERTLTISRPKQDYPRPYRQIGIAKPGSGISKIVARMENKAVDPNQKPKTRAGRYYGTLLNPR